ncbi:HlyD family secretion protein [Sphingomonas sp. Mn802worker]|uniref:HlyD family secretion protein n=1 Tax=Sphingomonas sp. Mn802worker TaxID=629773 RepID=UPI00035EAEA8|nr:HlyD family secretion protein [Sphingomonas sp. Mn802worker]
MNGDDNDAANGGATNEGKDEREARGNDASENDYNETKGSDENGDTKKDRRGKGDQADKDDQSDTDNDKSDDEDSSDDEDNSDDEDDDGKPPLYKRPIFWIVVAVVAAVLIIGGVLYWLHARRFQSTDDAFIDAHIVRIAAQESGQLTQVYRGDNSHVRAGQLLAVIEPGSAQATRAEAVAGISEADAQIRQAQAGVLAALASVRQARAQATVPLAEARRATGDYQRYADLRRLDPLAAAPTQIDQARAQADSALAQVRAARQQIGSAEADVLTARKRVEAARAQRRAAEARVAQSDVTVRHLVIRAPISGQVVNRSVNLGSYVAPGQQLMAIVPDDLWVTANFKETQLTLMRAGLPVRIRIDAFPGHDFAGHVDSIQRGAGQAFALLPPQNATGNYVKVVQRVPVRIRFNNNDWQHYAIGPGMSVVPRVTVRP